MRRQNSDKVDKEEKRKGREKITGEGLEEKENDAREKIIMAHESE